MKKSAASSLPLRSLDVVSLELRWIAPDRKHSLKSPCFDPLIHPTHHRHSKAHDQNTPSTHQHHRSPKAIPCPHNAAHPPLKSTHPIQPSTQAPEALVVKSVSSSEACPTAEPSQLHDSTSSSSGQPTHACLGGLGGTERAGDEELTTRPLPTSTRRTRRFAVLFCGTAAGAFTCWALI